MVFCVDLDFCGGRPVGVHRCSIVNGSELGDIIFVNTLSDGEAEKWKPLSYSQNLEFTVARSTAGRMMCLRGSL